jgi:hypothetical protein
VFGRVSGGVPSSASSCDCFRYANGVFVPFAFHYQDQFAIRRKQPIREMASAALLLVAIENEKFPVYDGTRLFKKAWIPKGKAQKQHAALLAGVTADKLSKDDADHILKRMHDVKKAFAGWMNSRVMTWWVENAKKDGLRNRKTGKPVTTFPELMEELESNQRMESFVTWYNICYKDTDMKVDVHNQREQDLMRELKLKYHDDTTVGGCVGDLILELQRKLTEQLNNRSKARQGLGLVKSRPTFDDKKKKNAKDRRKEGDFYIVKCDEQGRNESYKGYNVSGNHISLAVFGLFFLTIAAGSDRLLARERLN